MLGFSAFELARLQFAFTVSFHIIFPAITIGLASYLAVLEALWLIRRNPVYVELYHFWSKIFAVNFGMGVVSGLVMAYEFGTNWSGFSQFAGGVTGPLLTYEVLTAFFLEAGFLGVMLFGWNKVGPGLHMFATAMVAIGTLISTTWILASNSWMQTPQGFEIINGRVVPTDWLAVIFNPSFPFRLAHMTLAAYLSTALFVGAAGAWHLLRGRSTPAVRKMFSMALWMLLFVAPIQMFVGDAHGLNTLEHQPAKIAADRRPLAERSECLQPAADRLRHSRHEGGGDEIRDRDPLSRQPDPHPYAAWQDPGPEGIRAAGPAGFDDHLLHLPHHGRPWSCHAAARPLGCLSALAWQTLRNAALHAVCPLYGAGRADRRACRLDHHRGRAPAWVVYGILRTQDAVSNHSVLALSITLVMFIVMYFLLFGTGIGFMLKMVAHGPDEGRDGVHPHDGGQIQRPARPFSAAPDTFDTAPARETKEV